MLMLCTVLLDVPRYVLGAVAVFLVDLFPRPRRSSALKFSTAAVIAGYNEKQSIRKCVLSLQGQVNTIVVVDDGSTDEMWDEVWRMKNEGLVQKAFRVSERSSKPAAINLGLQTVTEDIVFIVDADTIVDRGAVQRTLSYFTDPKVGGVCPDLFPANESTSLITRMQAIEYRIGIGTGRRVADAFGILPNVSGGLGAFRMTAVRAVGGQDIEVAEDANFAMKLRRAGWELRFANDAAGRTMVPDTVSRLVAQRLRWDSAVVTIWWRKFNCLWPFSTGWHLREALLILDIALFNIALPIVFPIYVAWLWSKTGVFAIMLLLNVFLILLVVDVIVAALSRVPVRLLPYIPLYTVYNCLILRPVRLVSIIMELVFTWSQYDNYIPKHQRTWS